MAELQDREVDDMGEELITKAKTIAAVYEEVIKTLIHARDWHIDAILSSSSVTILVEQANQMELLRIQLIADAEARRQIVESLSAEFASMRAEVSALMGMCCTSVAPATSGTLSQPASSVQASGVHAGFMAQAEERVVRASRVRGVLSQYKLRCNIRLFNEALREKVGKRMAYHLSMAHTAATTANQPCDFRPFPLGCFDVADHFGFDHEAYHVVDKLFGY